MRISLKYLITICLVLIRIISGHSQKWRRVSSDSILQSRKSGPLNLFKYGARHAMPWWNDDWTEYDRNLRTSKYFNTEYGFEWNEWTLDKEQWSDPINAFPTDPWVAGYEPTRYFRTSNAEIRDPKCWEYFFPPASMFLKINKN